MKWFAILFLIAACLAVTTEAQQSTLNPTTTKSTTSKTTTPTVKVTTTTLKPIAITTLKETKTIKTTAKTTTSKPTVTSTTFKPTVTSSTLKPTVTSTTLKPTVTSTTLKPTVTSTTLKSTVKSTTLKPTVKSTTLKPTVKSTTLKPTVKSTTLKPTVKSTTLKPTVTSTTLKTTTTTTSKPTVTSTTLKPTVTSTTLKPTVTTTTLKPTVTSTTLKPTVTSTTLKPTVTSTTLKPTVTSTTLKTTTTTTTSKPTVTSTTLKPTVTSTTLKTTTTTTSKPTVTSTTLETTITTTTSKPTVTSTTLKPTVTSTTLKPTAQSTVATTNVNQNVTTTTLIPATTAKLFACRDTNSTAASGTIQPDQNSTNSNCSFDIVAPSDQQIQIFCSSLNFSSATSSSLSINGSIDINAMQPVLNRVYYSTSNTLNLMYSRSGYGDSFHCNWTTAAKEITTESKLCRHAEATAANGTIQFLAGDTGPDRECSFLIKALPDQQIQLFCSAVNFTSNNTFTKYLRIDGTLDDRWWSSTPNSQRMMMYNSWTSPVLDRIYYSSGNNITISSRFGSQDSFQCKWATVPKEIPTINKLCRHAQSSMANGTIQPLASDGGPPRTCFFSVNVPSSQRIQISCSAVNITSWNGNLGFQGITEISMPYPGPVVNRVYYSVDNNVYVTSQFDDGDSFTCNWTAIPKENTTSLQFCRHGFTSMTNGTIEPFADTTAGEKITACKFVINATSNYQVQISCSDLNLTTTQFPYSYLTMERVADGYVYPAPVSNRMYYSIDNQIILTAGVVNTDWFSCKWTMVPKEVTAANKLCRNAVSTTINGTIQPLTGDSGPLRTCLFSLSALPYEKIQISCSNVTLNNSAGSYLSISTGMEYANPPVVNRVYTSTEYSQIYIYSALSGINNGDWFDCEWTITPRENTTDNKLCLQSISTSANGTIEPIAGDIEPPRTCYFTISALTGEKIQISCSNVNLTSATSSFSIYGILDTYYSLVPVVNRVYTSTTYNKIGIYTTLSNADWISCKWTTTSRKTSESKFCIDEQATSANGTIQSIAGDTGPPRTCPFSINVPDNQQIQISCSVVNLTGIFSWFSMSGSLDGQHIQPVVNRVYYSTTNIFLNSFLGDGDMLNCQWITIPKDNTSESKLCRHKESTAANGTIQPIAGDTGPPRTCSFYISAPDDQQIQISCPIVNFTEPSSYFSIDGTIDYAYQPVVNRVYTSRNNRIYINSQLGNTDSINCNWTTTPRMNTTDNKLCQNLLATTMNGTIQPIWGDTGPSRWCSFFIMAPYDQRIQVSCSVVNLTDLSSYVQITGIIDYANPPVVNRVYTSTTSNKIYINSQLMNNVDWITCNWTIAPRENTTNSKLCRDELSTSAYGTIQPLLGDVGPARECPFNITAPYDQQIQISCSVVNFTNSNSYLRIYESADYLVDPPTLNRVYTSSNSEITLDSFLGAGDWINCSWITVPKQNTTDNKMCRHAEATTASGTIQPLSGDTGPMRMCSFIIKAPFGQQILITCSAVNLTSASSSLSLNGIIDSVNPPTVNRVYYSTDYYISLTANLNNTDWFSCNWTTVSRENTTNNELCHHPKSSTANGTLQPILGDAGPSRDCPFFIRASPYDQEIQISCSVVDLTRTSSYLTISGAVDSGTINPPVVNRVYISATYNPIYIYSLLGNGDWINCSWTTTPKDNTTNNKLCRHQSTTYSYGTIQPMQNDPGPSRECSFYVYVYSSIQISCSVVNMTSPGSYLLFRHMYYGDFVVNPPEVNTTYSYPYGNVEVASRIGDGDWFDCKWEPTV